MNIPFKVDLKDQVAVVTGAGGILCSEMAKALALCGAKVAVADRSLEGEIGRASCRERVCLYV